MATLEGAVVGLLVLDGDELDQLHVDPPWRGHGIGDRLARGPGPDHPRVGSRPAGRNDCPQRGRGTAPAGRDRAV
ncbi:GNAT family N-acetyltransferase [Streptomyces exfoliatus]|uniref:GNAT family N-acetyltransferase n=1 Tax=Streptomyces exfoliatus TaxID=1905 RepID=UPI00068BD15C